MRLCVYTAACCLCQPTDLLPGRVRSRCCMYFVNLNCKLFLGAHSSRKKILVAPARAKHCIKTKRTPPWHDSVTLSIRLLFYFQLPWTTKLLVCNIWHSFGRQQLTIRTQMTRNCKHASVCVLQRLSVSRPLFVSCHHPRAGPHFKVNLLCCFVKVKIMGFV